MLQLWFLGVVHEAKLRKMKSFEICRGCLVLKELGTASFRKMSNSVNHLSLLPILFPCGVSWSLSIYRVSSKEGTNEGRPFSAPTPRRWDTGVVVIVAAVLKWAEMRNDHYYHIWLKQQDNLGRSNAINHFGMCSSDDGFPHPTPPLFFDLKLNLAGVPPQIILNRLKSQWWYVFSVFEKIKQTRRR